MSSLGRRFGALAAAVAVVAAAPGCGGSSGPPPASGLARAVPPNAALYADAVVHPTGPLKASLEASLGKLLGTHDPGGYLVSKLDRALRADHLSFARDIEPWLGERAGVFLTSFGSNPNGAVLIQTTDRSAALATLGRAATAGGRKPHRSSYHGVRLASAGDTAYAAVGDLAVAGSRAGVEAAIDAWKRSSLADSGAYRTSVAAAPADRVLTVWANPSKVLGALAAAGTVSPAAVKGVRREAGAVLRAPIALWGDATSDYLALEASFAQAPGTSGGPSLIGDFPSDSWLAFGFHESAQAAGAGQRGTNGGTALGIPGSAELQRALRGAGIDTGNLARWLGDISGFVRGSSIYGLGGALVISSRDRAASARTLAELRSAFARDADVVTERLGPGGPGFSVTPPGAPVEIVFTQRDGKVIIGLGQASIADALSSQQGLAESPAFKSAAAALGGLEPSLYLDFQPVARLFEVPGVINDPRFEQIKPYLDRLDYLIAGAGSDRGRALVRIALGVRAAGSGSGTFAAARSAAP